MNVFEFAREVEAGGHRFYCDMAERIGEGNSSQVFRMLAEDEEKMLLALQELEARHEHGRQESRFLGPKSNVFADLLRHEEQLRITGNLDAYRLALTAERTILDTYQQAIDREADPEVRSLLVEIAALDQHELEELQLVCSFAEAPNRSLEWGEFSNLGPFHNFGRYEG